VILKGATTAILKEHRKMLEGVKLGDTERSNQGNSKKSIGRCWQE